ncbi:D-ribose pyranase [Klebsiella pneumoniae]|uniref:D-ribose pyranase n=1 Tax=Klebsiella pneumoniae TaxID=573 RepID=A0A939SU76_KLEPN|nr:D-ribose pyranase [Klebsiella pneumoniae]
MIIIILAKRFASGAKEKNEKGTVLNADISAVISRLGHTDTLVVCDAGLPVPRSSTRIDMALTQGVPSFMQVLEVVTTEMQVEAAVIAEEIKPIIRSSTRRCSLTSSSCSSTVEIPLKFVTPAMSSSKQTADSQAVIRSGSVPVCEYHSLCRRHVLRSPSWKPYCN